MIIRKTPNIDKYIKVDNKTSDILHRNSFVPKYMDEKYIYYVRTQSIIDFMKKEGLQCLI